MTRVAWLDVRAGVAGDMLLGALVDHGVPVSFFETLAEKLAPGRLTLDVSRTERGALAATHVRVKVDGHAPHARDEAHLALDEGAPHGDAHAGHAHAHHTLDDVLGHLARVGPLDVSPMREAAAAYRALAEAEAAVHGKDPETVHFHEVGALDAILDIAGVCAGLHHLAIEQVVCSSLPWGQGTITAAHGVLPNPAPATLRLMEGFATHPSSATFEQVTPTGVALLRGLGATSGTPEGFVPEGTGLGAGTHSGHDLPNVVRLVTGEVPQTPAHETILELATNLDDTTPEVLAYTTERLLEAGALDAWSLPVWGKKGRQGWVMHVLAREESADALEAVLFRETPTLGIRRRTWRRHALPRAHTTVETPFGVIRMKVRATPEGEAASPEYEDCRACALEHGAPLIEVMDAARSAWAARA